MSEAATETKEETVKTEYSEEEIEAEAKKTGTGKKETKEEAK